MDGKNQITYDSGSIPELGIVEQWESLFLTPSEYVDLSVVVTRFKQIKPNATRALIKAEITAISFLDRDRKPTNSPYPAKVVLELSDGFDVVECTNFNAGDWKSCEVGDSITVLVNVKTSNFYPLTFNAAERARQRLTPRVDYSGISGKIAGNVIAYHAQEAVESAANIKRAVMWITQERPTLAKLTLKHWGDIGSLLRSLHAPQTMQEGRNAMAFVKRLCIAEVRHNARLDRSDRVFITKRPELRTLIWNALQTQPEVLSLGQLNALKVAVPALSGDQPGMVLLNGDVGTGKTLVFCGIVAGFASLGIPSVIMLPTDTLAQQVYGQFVRRFPQYECALVSAGAGKKELKGLVWIGTSALLHVPSLPKFGLAVIDEQHKFSKGQRQQLLSPTTHLIESSATPLPRSLALALFSGCALAEINTPAVKKNIRSHLILDGERSLVTSLHNKAIAEKQRVIYLYAAVNARLAKEKPDTTDTVKKKSKKTAEEVEPVKKESLRATKSAYEALNANYPGKVALVHGQMSAAKAAEEMDAFRSGEKPILVASSAIEVGVDVPDVRLLVVTNPEMFGISGLHQIRGRLARNGGDADFVMYAKGKLSKYTVERLQAVRSINDGFKLAERDLELRGFGEVAGDMQSGSTKTTFQLTKLKPEDFTRTHA